MSLLSDKSSSLPSGLAPTSSVIVVGGIVGLYVAICGTLTFDAGYDGLVIALLEMFVACLIVAEMVEGQHPSSGHLFVMGGCVAGIAAAMGILNHIVFYGPYLDATAGRVYEDVPATGKALAYSDAGIINFRSDVLVDQSRAVGISSHGRRYCVAPIMGHDTLEPDGSLKPIQFWAVGQDCCASRGDFQCGASRNAAVHSGITEQPTESLLSQGIFAPKGHYKEYIAGVKAAASLHSVDGFSSAEEPVLVYWVEDPEDVLKGWRAAAIGNWVLSSIVVLVSAAAVWISVMTHYNAHIHSAAKSHKAYGAMMFPSSPAAGGDRPAQDPYLVKP